MIAGLSRRDGRMLLLGLASVGTILAAGKGTPALRHWEASSIAAAVELRGQLVAAERGATSLAEIRDSASARSRRLESLRGLLLRAPSPEAAAATLASLVERIAKQHDVDVLTVTLKPDSVVHSGFSRAAVRLSAETDVAGLLDLLFEIERTKMPLLVTELWVTQPEPAAPTSKAETLRIEIGIQTLAQVSASPVAKGGVRR
jgi:hypothetical protein